MLIPSDTAKNLGHLILTKNLSIVGASEIIAKIHKKDNWNDTLNKLNGLQSSIITPAMLNALRESYSLLSILQIQSNIAIILALQTLGVKEHR